MRDDDASAVKQRLLHRASLFPQRFGIDVDAPSIAHNLSAGDDDIAYRTAIGAPNQLQANVAARRPSPAARSMNDHVRLLSNLQ